MRRRNSDNAVVQGATKKQRRAIDQEDQPRKRKATALGANGNAAIILQHFLKKLQVEHPEYASVLANGIDVVSDVRVPVPLPFQPSKHLLCSWSSPEMGELRRLGLGHHVPHRLLAYSSASSDPMNALWGGRRLSDTLGWNLKVV